MLCVLRCIGHGTRTSGGSAFSSDSSDQQLKTAQPGRRRTMFGRTAIVLALAMLLIVGVCARALAQEDAEAIV